MNWTEARRLAEVAQYGADPATYVEPADDVTTWAVQVVEGHGRYIVTFQPAPLQVPGIPAQITPAVPHSGQYQVDQATGAVRYFQALPGDPGTEDYWDGRVAWAHPLLVGEE